MTQKSHRESDDKTEIFDPLRRKYVALTPEERVRQDFIALLLQMGYPRELMANEYAIKIGTLSRRCDTVVFDKDLSPLMVIEYKAPYINLNQQVIDQAFRYNSVMGVKYIIITNGKQAGIYRVGYDGKRTVMLNDIPYYEELKNS